ncbi:NUDIX hydrolase [Cohnella caldifontis]|uniref:NUDIX hydrolase n=1 Tax=Cohnella caldifontis TaxID=3027471 RepID=UPI0023EBA6CB|nr:NUDIX domain-containing protein [Cohnella sp. YIM B05605]
MVEEIFDIYDAEGKWVGTAPRSEVHARGHWHRTVHCWLVRRGEDGKARVLFQLRSDGKDTNPGRCDITAAGHLAAGETPREAVRELEEELGLAVAFEELVPYAVVREEASGIVRGKRFVDREVSHVFGYVTDWRPGQFRLQEEEVAGLYEAEAGELIALMEGGLDEVSADGIRLREGAAEPGSIAIRASSFVPRDPAYYVGVFRFLEKLARGSDG